MKVLNVSVRRALSGLLALALVLTMVGGATADQGSGFE